jgi:hypothetical protein
MINNSRLTSSSLFPLPLFPTPHSSLSSSRRCRQRVYRSRSSVIIFNSVIVALNHLHDQKQFRTSQYMNNNNHHHNNNSDLRPSASQSRIMQNIVDHCRCFYRNDNDHQSLNNNGRRQAFGSMSDTHTIQQVLVSFTNSFHSKFNLNHQQHTTTSSQSFLNEIISSDMETFTHMLMDDEARPRIFDYSSTMKPSAVPLIAERVALPSSIHSVPMLSALPISLQQYYSESNSDLFRSSTDIQRPAHAFASQREYVTLLKRMKSVGMVNFTTSPLCVNGCFGVPKPDGEIRLVIDAQPANALFCAPPHVDLPTPSTIAQVDTSQLDAPFYVSKCDLSNFYHHIALPAFMQPYFALPAIKASDIGVECESEYVYPMCTTMPMGWSHAVYVAQAVHLHILYKDRALEYSDNILFSSRLVLDRPVHFVYIDDLTIMAPSLIQAQTVFGLVLQKYEEAGFVVKMSKVVEPTTESVEVLGVEISGATHTLSVSSTKMKKLQRATSFLMQLGSCTGHTLSQIIGSWIWPCLIRRPSLSIFKQSYRFIAIAQRRSFILWPSVIRELALVSFLAPLLQLSLRKSNFRYLIATDASEMGGGLVSTSIYHHSNTFMSQDASILRHVQPHKRPTLSIAEREQHEIAASSVSSYWWKTIASYKWSYPAHINMYEMNALLTGIKWASSFPDAMGTKLHALTDSASVLYSTTKGRSSSQLSSLLQRLAAYLFAFDIVLTTYWIPSLNNPADAPSRQ